MDPGIGRRGRQRTHDCMYILNGNMQEQLDVPPSLPPPVPQNHACASLTCFCRSLIDTSHTLKTTTETKILYVSYGDLRPLFSCSFALRKYAEEHAIALAHPTDFPKVNP